MAILAFFGVFLVFLIPTAVIALIVTPIVSYKNINNIFYHNDYEGAMDYLLEHYDPDEVVLYADYNNGGYPEFRGVKSYIDPRAEVFLKGFNGKEDILAEFFNKKSTTIPYLFYKYKNHENERIRSKYPCIWLYT